MPALFCFAFFSICGCWILESHLWQEMCSSAFDKTCRTKRWSGSKEKKKPTKFCWRQLLCMCCLQRKWLKKKKKGAESLHRSPSRHRARVISSGSVPARTIICAAADNAAVSQPPESVGRLESDRKHCQQRAVVFVQLEQKREGWTRSDEEWRMKHTPALTSQKSDRPEMLSTSREPRLDNVAP